MAKQVINVGIQPNDGTGDSLRTGAFKINQNFDELYAAVTTGINSISNGEGIAVTNSFGQVIVTNSMPNRGSFNSILVDGQDDVTTNLLTDSLTFVAGQNVTLTTDQTEKSITISVENLDAIDLNGDFSGTFTGVTSGTISGTFTGEVNSTDIDTSLLKISGNAAEALNYFQGIQQQKDEFVDDVAALNNQLDGLESDLQDAQNSLAYWQGQPDSPEKTQAISLLNSQISTLLLQITGVQNEISDKGDSIDYLNGIIDELEPTLNYPYTSITYDTTTLTWTSNRKLSVPGLIINNQQFPTELGEVGQSLITNGAGVLTWNSILGNLSINNTTLRPKLNGNSISLETYDTQATTTSIDLHHLKYPGAPFTFDTSLSIGPGGILLGVEDQQALYTNEGINFNYKQAIRYGEDSIVAASSTGIIFTSIETLNSSTMKLVIHAECFQISNIETQAVEMIVTKNQTDLVVCSVYGVVHTGLTPIATFDAQWNAVTSRIEVTATNTSEANQAKFRVHAVEISRIYD